MGLIVPASRPLHQAPAMMPLTLSTKNHQNCVGASCRCSPSQTGAASTYKNMPLNGIPLASDSAMNRGLDPSCQ